jgi:hypothetical protein
VHTHERLMPFLRTKVMGDKLIVWFGGGTPPGIPREVTVHSPSLRAVTQLGSGDLAASGLSAGHLRVVLKGSGDVVLDGEARSLELDLRGSGDVAASQLHTSTARVVLRGSGDAAVHAVRSAVILLSGSGDVTLTGNATIRETVRGSGDITRL